jgi:hypothetical protein
MVEQIFHVGERVRAGVRTAFVDAGAEGMVCGWYPFLPEAYDVAFDGYNKSWLMWDDELEPVSELTEAEASA